MDANGAAYAACKRGGHVTQIMRCRLPNQATSRLIEMDDELSRKELKSLFRAEEKLVSLQPCIQQCKQVMEKHSCA